MLRYPASSAVDTTCSVSRGATWKVPKPSWGICTLLFKVMVDTSFILAATHAHRESVPRRMYQPDADRALRGVQPSCREKADDDGCRAQRSPGHQLCLRVRAALAGPAGADRRPDRR